ncbi:hypothetical protein COO60DRAFT_1537868 [Scenedesmus sp. NREL 46B-D3]|nr:hypothetical protein COO60DRAFT_1537868 [Scenedesmus sp. NREL 46B-D3]
MEMFLVRVGVCNCCLTCCWQLSAWAQDAQLSRCIVVFSVRQGHRAMRCGGCVQAAPSCDVVLLAHERCSGAGAAVKRLGCKAAPVDGIYHMHSVQWVHAAELACRRVVGGEAVFCMQAVLRPFTS